MKEKDKIIEEKERLINKIEEEKERLIKEKDRYIDALTSDINQLRKKPFWKFW